MATVTFKKSVSNSVSNSNNLEIYQKVSRKDTFATRASFGHKSTLSLLGEDVVVKKDLSGDDLISWEYEIYTLLEGLEIAPRCYLEEGSDYGLHLEKINNGAAFEDYAISFLQGEIPEKIMAEIFSKVGKTLNIFWEEGFVHRDLHLRNLVIGLDERDDFKVYLIDFSSSSHSSNDEEWGWNNGYSRGCTPTQEDNFTDIKDAIWCLFDNWEESPSKFLRAMEDEITVI